MIVTYLNPGEFFGEMGLFEEHPRSAWMKTKTDCEVCEVCEVCEISYSKFTALYQKEPEILFSVAKQIAKRFRKTTQKASDLAFLSVTGLITQVLKDLAKQPDAMTHPDGMQIKITRQEIGRIAVCSREMAGRVIKELESHGLISVAGKTMVLLGA